MMDSTANRRLAALLATSVSACVVDTSTSDPEEPIGRTKASPEARAQSQRLTDNLDTVDQAPAASSPAHFTTADRAGPRTPGAPRP